MLDHKKEKTTNDSRRLYFLGGILALGMLALIWRLLDLTVFDRHFLIQQSDARAVRIIDTPAYRGMITDRFGTPLAISTPVDSAWVNPQMFEANDQQIRQLADLLGMSVAEVKQDANDDSREFVYLKRGLSPDVADKIRALQIPGIFFQREYRRYYPEGDVAAHVIGFTNIDDEGQEGLELGFDNSLRGIPGKERVLKDRLGNTIAIMNVLSEPVQGQNITLSLDSRIQYLAYTNLQAAMTKFHAASGSVIVLNPKTGEVLAMVNLPSYNPNQRPSGESSSYRNRAVTDIYEPGSTMKAFTLTNGLESGKYTPQTIVDTNPGYFVIQGHKITDDVPNNGAISLTKILQVSSNIGAAKVTLSLPPESLYNLLTKFGFGQTTGSGFPGESPGILQDRTVWQPINLATISFGYGISVTPLQLAHAYSAFANNGVQVPITFVKQNSIPAGKQVIPPNINQEMVTMLEAVVNGTGMANTGNAAADPDQAAVPGYQVAGKTGTAYTAVRGGYDKSKYNSSFIGFAPASNPQLLVAVILNGVQGGAHFGAQVAAPAFANIMGASLRLLDIPPDNLNPVTKTKT